MDTKGEKRWGGGGGGVMNWEIGTDMYTLMCIKWMTNKNLLYKKKMIKFRKKEYLMKRKAAVDIIQFSFHSLHTKDDFAKTPCFWKGHEAASDQWYHL